MLKIFKATIIFYLLLFNVLFADNIDSGFSKDNQKVTLQLSWFDQFQFAGYYIAKEQEYLKNKTKISMCINPDNFPFEKITDKKHIGFTSNIINLISKKVNIPINLIETFSWDESLKKARNRECDILPMLSPSKDTQKYMNFTSPYLDTQIVIATKSNDTYINNINQYLDKTFVILTNNLLSEILVEKYPNIKLIEVDSINEGFEKVIDEECFGYIGNSLTIIHKIQSEYYNAISISGQLNFKLNYGIATRNDEKLLNSIFEKALVSIDKNEMQDIKNRYFYLKQDLIVDYSLIWQIITFFLFFLILVIIFFIKQNKLKTKIECLNSILNEKITVTTSNLEIAQKITKIGFWEISDDILVWSDEVYEICEIDKEIHKISSLKDFKQYVLPDDLDTFNLLCENDILENNDYLILYGIITPNNNIKYIETRFIKLFNQIKGTIQDITERRLREIATVENEKKMFQQYKLAQMGKMLGNITHQWRQPLSEINSIMMKIESEFISKNTSEESLNKNITQIENITEHMSHTIDIFSHFFNKDKTKIVFTIFNCIEEILKLHESTLSKYDIQIILNISKNTKIITFKNEFMQVMITLLENSKDAFLGKKIKNKSIEISLENYKMCTKIIFLDNAGGIKSTVIDNVFEPYFSTKPRSQGRGLGLYTAKMIIEKSMNGKLEVSNKQNGAEFTITIPN